MLILVICGIVLVLALLVSALFIVAHAWRESDLDQN